MDLDKKINWYGEEIPIKEFFRDVLKNILIHNPPKRFMGNSDWWILLREGLIKTGNARGSMDRCNCEEGNFCNDTPCYDPVFDDEEMKEDIIKVINTLIP